MFFFFFFFFFLTSTAENKNAIKHFIFNTKTIQADYLTHPSCVFFTLPNEH
jgi:hypothetical protein